MRRIKAFVLKQLVKVIYRVLHSPEYKALTKTVYAFKHLGANPIIAENSIIKNPAYISIGDNFYSLSNLRLEAWDSYMDDRFSPELIIGNNVSVNTDIHIGCIDKVVIGNNVMMGSRIYITDHTHGDISAEELQVIAGYRRLKSKGPVFIEDNVWIGEGVCILPGVTIGENSVIGANAVVNKSFPKNSVIAGVPAKLIKSF